MTDPLDSATESLSDYTRKMDIATFYANGDAERARQIVAGTLRDFFVIKGRFSTTSSFGAFIAFLNNQYLVLNSVYPVIADSFDLKEMKTSHEWRIFEKDLAEFAAGGDHDDVLARQFRTVFTNSLTPPFVTELKKLVEDRDEIEINRVFQKMVQDRMGFQGVSMSVDIEQIPSVEMELYSVTSNKMIARAGQGEGAKGAGPDIEILPDEDEEVLREREVRLVLRGSLILSPINGRDIGLLVMGDRIKIKIVDTHQKAVQVLKAFNAYREDGSGPITGRIISIKHRADGGYTIFAIVAKGIYVKIDEMESNIKIAIDTAGLQGSDDAPRSKIGIFFIAGLAVVLVLLVGLLIYLVK